MLLLLLLICQYSSITSQEFNTVPQSFWYQYHWLAFYRIRPDAITAVLFVTVRAGTVYRHFFPPQIYFFFVFVARFYARAKSMEKPKI